MIWVFKFVSASGVEVVEHSFRTHDTGIEIVHHYLYVRRGIGIDTHDMGIIRPRTIREHVTISNIHNTDIKTQ